MRPGPARSQSSSGPSSRAHGGSTAAAESTGEGGKGGKQPRPVTRAKTKKLNQAGWNSFSLYNGWAGFAPMLMFAARCCYLKPLATPGLPLKFNASGSNRLLKRKMQRPRTRRQRSKTKQRKNRRRKTKQKRNRRQKMKTKQIKNWRKRKERKTKKRLRMVLHHLVNLLGKRMMKIKMTQVALTQMKSRNVQRPVEDWLFKLSLFPNGFDSQIQLTVQSLLVQCLQAQSDQPLLWKQKLRRT